MRTSFTIPGPVVGKPRQTQSDRWRQRPVVLAYRAWADQARIAATGSPTQHVEGDILGLIVFAHFPMPDSWNADKKAAMAGTLHRQKPDSDNVLKAAGDALLREDKTVPLMQCYKFWCEQNEEPRMDVFLLVTPRTPHTAPSSTT